MVRAAQAVQERTGNAPELEIMIPLVAYEKELEDARAMVEGAIELEGGAAVDASIGTMIELPRACFIANKIAEHADFFSFGTNDLTQSALGFSRDDVEGRILSTYLERKIVDRSPFETIDKPGVGWLVRLAAWVGREGHPGLKLGICGEHGGDPDSIAFFDMAGLDYVSCSPFRVPIARLAAAQAQLTK
jgi:pyruvate,orthophosphate dikinase